jgi:hypothetical protein
MLEAFPSFNVIHKRGKIGGRRSSPPFPQPH